MVKQTGTKLASRRRKRRGMLALAQLSIAALGLVIAPGAAVHAAGAAVWSVTGRVFVIRDGAAGKILVKAGMPLNEADELEGVTNESSVLIQCPNGAAQTLSGPFNAIINRLDGEAACTIDLRTGTAVATTAPANEGGGASLRAGPIAMVSVHTQFGMHVTPQGNDRAVDRTISGFVLDGQANCRDDRTERAWSVNSGQQIDIETRKFSSIDAKTYQRLARTFARLDANQLTSADPQLEEQLTARWLAVLQYPDDARARIELSRIQGSSVSAVARYQRARAKSLAQRSGDPALESKLTRPAPPAPILDAAPPEQTTQPERMFRRPRHKEHRLDSCLYSGKECGKPAADAWCRQQGYSRASKLEIEENIGAATPTLVLGDGRVCADMECDGFQSVTCR